MASGSVQLPRFTLLESGSLLISPSHLSDAGTYTCMASNSRGIDEASSDLLVWGKQKYIYPSFLGQNTATYHFELNIFIFFAGIILLFSSTVYLKMRLSMRYPEDDCRDILTVFR